MAGFVSNCIHWVAFKTPGSFRDGIGMAFGGVAKKDKYYPNILFFPTLTTNSLPLDDAIPPVGFPVFTAYGSPGRATLLLQAIRSREWPVQRYGLLRHTGQTGLYVVWHKRRHQPF